MQSSDMCHMVMRLKAPIMGWGKPGRRDIRLTELFPGKGCAVGVNANARGIERDDEASIAEMCQLKMWAFCAKPGTPMVDFQTAQNTVHMTKPRLGEKYGQDIVPVGNIAHLKMWALIPKPGYQTLNSKTLSKAIRWDNREDPVVMHRHYLAGAAFVVVLSGQADLVKKCGRALSRPVRPLFIGKKAFIPSVPIMAGVYTGQFELDNAAHVESVIRDLGGSGDIGAVWDCNSDEANDMLMDVPIRFGDNGAYRRRFVHRDVVSIG